MKPLLSICILLILLNSCGKCDCNDTPIPENLSADSRATTESGKVVLLNSDGTWKYADLVSDDSTTADPIDLNDCSNLINTSEDRVTGITYTSSKNYLVIDNPTDEGGHIAMSFFLGSEKSITWGLDVFGAGQCINEGDKINILFTDGSRMELQNDSDFNCEKRSTVYFGSVWGKQRQLSDLINKKIQIIRVWTDDSFIEKEFDNTDAITFQNTLRCLTGRSPQ